MGSVDWNFISEREGGQWLNGYVPVPETSQSGVTIATGVDLGARSEADLQRLGLDPTLVNKLKPYLGKKKLAADTFLKANPLTITRAQADALDVAVKGQALQAIKNKYNAALGPGATQFDDLFSEAQTTITSVGFQYGSNLSTRTPSFWKASVEQDWDAVIDELNNFGDKYEKRRKLEADYLKEGWEREKKRKEEEEKKKKEDEEQKQGKFQRDSVIDDEGKRKTGEAIVVSLPPDVCLTPVGSGMVPVPYTITGRFNTVMRERPTVRFTHMEVFTAISRITTVTGDEAGSGGGVASGRNVGYCRSIVHSTTVRVEGNWVVRNNDTMDMNMNGPNGIGNTVGRIIYIKVVQVTYLDEAGNIEGDTNPPVEPETEEEIGFWGQVGGFFKGAWDAGVETVEGVASLAKGAFNLTPTGMLLNPEGTVQTLNTLKTVGSAVWESKGGVLWDAIKEPYVTAWSEGRYGEAIGRGTFEAVTAIIGTKGADKLAKGAGLADDVARVADDVARIGDDVAGLADDAARLSDDAARLADDAARLADDAAETADDAVDIARAGDDGARVTRTVEIPSVRGGAFRRWFDELSPDEFDEIWADPALRKKIEARLRHPGGQHEWLLVSRAPVFKRWGMSADDIAQMRTPISDVVFKNPPGRHGLQGSGTAHNELLRMVDTSSDFNTYRSRLQSWADNRLEGGAAALPEGLRP